MKDFVVAVKVHNRNVVRSGREAEVLIHVCSLITAKLYAIVPNLNLAYRDGFTGVRNDVDCGHVESFVRCRRYDLKPIR